MKANTLTQAWLEIELDINKKILAEAIRDMNESLHSKHTPSRVREWEHNRNGRGDRLPRTVRQYMGRIVIKYVLCNAGLKAAKMHARTASRIVDLLS